ncbi:unnamed protein product, partial [Effrenium voratum]
MSLQVEPKQYGEEWSFGGLCAGDDPEDGFETGIWSSAPQTCRQHTFRESLVLGPTALSHREVLELVYEMSEDWPMNSYDLLRRNCCHFCDELSCLLGVGPLPDWVLNLAGVGAILDDGISQVTSKLRAAANKFKVTRGNVPPAAGQ